MLVQTGRYHTIADTIVQTGLSDSQHVEIDSERGKSDMYGRCTDCTSIDMYLAPINTLSSKPPGFINSQRSFSLYIILPLLEPTQLKAATMTRLYMRGDDILHTITNLCES